jgi:hypothetical protein
MSLARMTPGPAGFHTGTFECSGCHHVQRFKTEIDPMKSNAMRWLAGHDLRSPN